MENAYRRIYAVVARIPRGRVATYGQVARLAGIPRGARQVGYALSALDAPPPAQGRRGVDRPRAEVVPWHRVVNAAGRISGRAEPGFEDEQRGRLEREGVRFSADGRISLRRVQWNK